MQPLQTLRLWLAGPEGQAGSAREKPSRNFVRTREYIDRAFSEAYKREIDQNENVWRTIPGFVASIAFYAALAGLVISKLPPVKGSCWVALGYVLATISVAFGVCAFCFLWHAIRGRDYQGLPLETSTLSFVRDTESHYSAHDLDQDSQDYLALTDVQSMFADSYALAIAANRELNKSRYRGRANATICLLCAYAFAAPVALGCLRSEKLHPPTNPSATQSESDAGAKAAAAAATSAETAAPTE